MQWSSLFNKGHRMVNGPSSRLPVPRFEGRFFIAFLSTFISISVFVDVTQRVEISG